MYHYSHFMPTTQLVKLENEFTLSAAAHGSERSKKKGPPIWVAVKELQLRYHNLGPRLLGVFSVLWQLKN